MFGPTDTNFIFEPGKLTILLDGGAGSSGKGKLGAFVTQHADNWQFCCNTFAPQAGHWVKNDDQEYFYQTFNSCAHQSYYEKMYLGPGAIIELPAFLRELEENSIEPHRIGISPVCGILQDQDSAFERGEMDLNGKPLPARQEGTMKHGCFTGDTKILLANGRYKRIDHIASGDRIINRRGQPTTVKSLINQGKRKTATIKTSGWHRPVHVTPDHEFWIGDLSGLKKTKGIPTILDRPTGKGLGIPAGQSRYKFKPVKDCQHATRTLCPRKIEFEQRPAFTIDLACYFVSAKIESEHIETHGSTAVCTHRYIESGYELGYLFGTFLGDGCARVETIKGGRTKVSGEQQQSETGKITWYFEKRQIAIATKVCAFIHTTFGIQTKPRPNKNMLVVKLYNKMAAKLFDEFGKKQEKHLPEKYYATDVNYLQGIYDGLVDSDGNTSKRSGTTSVASTSEQIIELIYFCNLVLGHSTGASYRPAHIGHIKGQRCHMSASYKARTHATKKHTKDYFFSRITHYQKPEDPQQVYDLEIDDDDHTFIANNCIVHNSTCHGVGAALARRRLRRPDTKLARDIPELKQYLCDVPGEIMSRLDRGQAGLLEIAQGFQLSYLLPDMFPYCTSRNCTVAAGLDDMMLPPYYAGNVLLNYRTYPIRISNYKYIAQTTAEIAGETISVGAHLTWDQLQAFKEQGLLFERYEGHSGPGYADQAETDWDTITQQSGSADPIMEITSVTKLPRRVFTFSRTNVADSVRHNRTAGGTFLSINFANYVDANLLHLRRVGWGRGCHEHDKVDTARIYDWCRRNVPQEGARLTFIGTGPRTDDFLLV